MEAVACVWIAHFAVRVELLRRPALDGVAVVLQTPVGERPLVADCSPEAAATGVRAGMAVREVLALCPQATVLPSDPVHYARTFERIIVDLQRLAPAVESAEPGCAFLDLSGLEALYGSLEGLVVALGRALLPGLRPRLGFGSGKFVARVAAERARAGGYLRVPGEHTAGFLKPLPVRLLPVSTEMLRRLDLFGIRTLGGLIALPRHAVQAQFGAAGAQAWDLASGKDGEHIRGRHWEEVIRETLSFPAPATSLEAFFEGIRLLVGRALRRRELGDRTVRQVRLRARLEDGQSWERTLTLREPTADLARLRYAIVARLGDLELPGPVDELALEFLAYGSEFGRQSQLFGSVNAERTQQLEAELRQLGVRLGRPPVARIVEVEPWSRLPERRHALIDYDP